MHTGIGRSLFDRRRISMKEIFSMSTLTQSLSFIISFTIAIFSQAENEGLKNINLFTVLLAMEQQIKQNTRVGVFARGPSLFPQKFELGNSVNYLALRVRLDQIIKNCICKHFLKLPHQNVAAVFASI